MQCRNILIQYNNINNYMLVFTLIYRDSLSQNYANLDIINEF